MPVTIIRGKVAEGKKLGRQLGFPTANIPVGGECTVVSGVYAAVVSVEGRRYEGMANVGYAPSVAGAQAGRMLEVNIFGFDGDIYGHEIEVELHRFIRPEEKFASIEELRASIEQARSIVQDYFKTNI